MKVNPYRPNYIAWLIGVAACAAHALAQTSPDQIVDLNQVPQLHETTAQRDARMQWFRDAKFGMFIHWGPCTVGDREIGWGRKANRPWDINGVQTPRTTDPDYDHYFERFNPVKYDADAWVRLAQEAGMKYMVLIAKHHDGFAQFDSKLTDYDIMATPYGKDIVRQFVDACHQRGMKVGLYYSTRDWYHPDYLVGDNVKYDTWYRGQIEELLSHYGKIDVMWFDHVGGRDWGKWRFDLLFAMLYRLQPGLLVNNRAAAFCGPASPGDRGPVTPDIRVMTRGDFDTPEQRIGAMNLKRDWESCMILSPTPQHDGWSYRSNGQTRPLEECIRMLASIASGGGNLLLNFGPDQFGEFRPEEVAIAKGMGAWLRKYGQAIYGTRGGPFTNGQWGGSTHRGKTVYLHVFEWPDDRLRLPALPRKINHARLLPDRDEIIFAQNEGGIEVSVPAARRDHPVTVLELTLDQPLPPDLLVGPARPRSEDAMVPNRQVGEPPAVLKRAANASHQIAGALDLSRLRNPVWATPDNLRDPSVLKVPGAYRLFYSRLAGTAWGSSNSWTVAEVRTRDFVHFESDRDVSPKGHASPGDVVFWHGRYLLPYQTYPAVPTQLCYSESSDLEEWSAPKPFLTEARFLPWNTLQRVIDPTLVVEGDTLHCFFVGSANVTNASGKTLRANLLGHAITRDPKLEHWEILTVKEPLLGVSERAPDGVENVMVFRTGDHWTMIYSEGLADQHLARATSADLRVWQRQGPIELPRQRWMARKYGAPFVWREDNQWLMILMGENSAGKTTFGLLSSPDSQQWTLLPESAE